MIARDIMIQQVYKVKDYDTVQNVIELFLKYRISGLPIVNDRNEIVGYISDGDIMRYIGKQKNIVIDTLWAPAMLLADEEDFTDRTAHLLTLNVMRIAKKKVWKIEWNEDIENVAAILGKKQIKKLPVERDGVLVGIISRGDVIRHAFKTLIDM